MTTEFQASFVLRASLIASMGGLLFGYDWVVIAGAKPFYESNFGISDSSHAWWSSWAMSSALVGCLFGAAASGFVTDRLGRKRVLLVAAVLFISSAVWTALAPHLASFAWSRIVGGLGIGLASNVSPMYISEIAPKSIRGRLVSINQLAIVVGILSAQLVNLAIYNYSPTAPDLVGSGLALTWNGQIGWRIMFAAECLPAVTFFFLTLTLPESPRWLVGQNKLDEARLVLGKIFEESVALDEVKRVQLSFAESTNMGILSSVQKNETRRILLVGVFLATFQQWCGINVIFNYAQEVFLAAGFTISSLMINIAITGLVNLLFTLLAMKIIDVWGRRPMIMIGALGLAICYVLLGLCFWLEWTGMLVLVLVFFAIAIYAMTLAPVTWVLLAELFPNRIRSAAMSVCVSVLWIACFLLTISYKPLNLILGAAGTFGLYALICLAGTAVIMATVPETKRKSLEQIQDEVCQSKIL